VTTAPAGNTQAHPFWQAADLPDSQVGWIARAAEVGAVLTADAAARDRAGEAPAAEVALLKDSGLVTLLGPREAAGGGANWATAYMVTREVAKADASIAMLLGYHYLWVWLPRMWATREQWQRMEADSARRKLFWAAAVNPRDNDVLVVDAGDHLLFTGIKRFSTGARVADWLLLEGVLADADGKPTEQRVFGLTPADRPQIVRSADWDNVGMRLTESGSVELRGVPVPWSDALGYTGKTQEVTVYASLTTLVHQLVFVNLYLGIAQGALAAAAQYTRTHTRPWPNAVSVDSATEDPYILAAYGQMGTETMATEALTDRAVREIQEVHDDPGALTERRRGELMALVMAAKVQASQAGLDVTNRIFEVTGSRATASRHGLDRYWRDLRTHTLHDPLAYKLREIGDFVLNDRIPEPGWYS
jgi:alkylation response protein AidB-like acyl-CoA dehydrogenase